MKITEQLCKLLVKQGLSYQTDYMHTSFYVGSKLYFAVDNLDGTFTVDNLKPEQVIAATVGEHTERTCHDMSVDSSTQFYCSECECTVEMPLLWGELNYCPCCGRKLEDK